MSKTQVERRISNDSDVRWLSQGGGFSREKRGQIRVFVPAGKAPEIVACRARAKVNWSRWRGEDATTPRRAASYIVEVPRKGRRNQELASDFYCVLKTVLDDQNPRAKREVIGG